MAANEGALRSALDGQIGDSAGPAPQRKLVDLLLVSGAGSTLSFYDFTVYAFVAPILAHNFFPTTDKLAGLSAAFMVMGVGFLARPAGALLLGLLADRVGRKPSLLLSYGLMGLGTAGIGLLPTYKAIGVAAPLLLVLLRLIQGLAAGGEYGGSVVFLLEWTAPGRRGLFGGIAQVAIALGALLGALVTAVLSSVLSPGIMDAWGWRLVFLLGLLIIPVMLTLNARVGETPQFLMSARSSSAGETPQPIRPVGWLIVLGLYLSAIVGTQIGHALPSFAQALGIDRAKALWSTSLQTLVMIVLLPVSGALSDRIGRKPLVLLSFGLVALGVVPLYMHLTAARSVSALVMLQLCLGAAMGLAGGLTAMIVELFPTRARVSSLSFLYALLIAAVGGFTPALSALAIRASDRSLAPAIVISAASAISFLTALLLVRDKASSDFRGEGNIRV
jgi:MHS family proline/betaine transporter-like MFS transporter